MSYLISFLNVLTIVICTYVGVFTFIYPVQENNQYFFLQNINYGFEKEAFALQEELASIKKKFS
eukprot:Pgem_evm1s2234